MMHLQVHSSSNPADISTLAEVDGSLPSTLPSDPSPQTPQTAITPRDASETDPLASESISRMDGSSVRRTTKRQAAFKASDRLSGKLPMLSTSPTALNVEKTVDLPPTPPLSKREPSSAAVHQKPAKKQRSKKKFDEKSKDQNQQDYVEQSECCICSLVISGTAEQFESHVQECALIAEQQQENNGEEDEEEFETYEWAGETRVRAISGIGTSIATAFGYTSNKNSKDTTDDLDIDNDDSAIYGCPQFTHSDLIYHYPKEEQEEPSQQKQKQQPAKNNRKPTTTSKLSPEQKLIASLKQRIQELDANKFHCLICMDPYADPLTSILCWHVHCKKCWLQALANKKVCPQCNVVTMPQDLRRIYL